MPVCLNICGVFAIAKCPQIFISHPLFLQLLLLQPSYQKKQFSCVLTAVAELLKAQYTHTQWNTYKGHGNENELSLESIYNFYHDRAECPSY